MKHTGWKTWKVGTCDISTCENGKQTKIYFAWANMLERCYSEKYLSKRPTYSGCSVCDEWLTFSNFKQWFDSNYIEGNALDKDILIVGNKIYSPTTCCFVPNHINNLFRDKATGVRINKRYKTVTYQTRIKIRGKEKFIGAFSTFELARSAFIIEKKKYSRDVVEECYKNNKISISTYNALISKIEIIN